MQGIALNQIPGLREAVNEARAKQERIRENAWKNLPYDFLGVQIRLMTVGDYLILDHYGSPFLYRQDPQMCDLAFFLWVLSPECLHWNKRRVQFGRSFYAFLHSRRMTKRFEHDGIFQNAVKAAFKYVDEVFTDCPASSGGKSPVCYIASWFDAIQSQHHISEQEIYEMPLPQLFQRIKAIQVRNGVNVPTFDKFEDELKLWVQNGIRSNRFTYEDLAQGRVKFGEN